MADRLHFLDFMHEVRAGEIALSRAETEEELRAAWARHVKPYPSLLAARDKRLAEIRGEGTE